jgi:hypothetical protein
MMNGNAVRGAERFQFASQARLVTDQDDFKVGPRRARFNSPVDIDRGPKISPHRIQSDSH